MIDLTLVFQPHVIGSARYAPIVVVPSLPHGLAFARARGSDERTWDGGPTGCLPVSALAASPHEGAEKEQNEPDPRE